MAFRCVERGKESTLQCEWVNVNYYLTLSIDAEKSFTENLFGGGEAINATHKTAI